MEHRWPAYERGQTVACTVIGIEDCHLVHPDRWILAGWIHERRYRGDRAASRYGPCVDRQGASYRQPGKQRRQAGIAQAIQRGRQAGRWGRHGMLGRLAAWLADWRDGRLSSDADAIPIPGCQRQSCGRRVHSWSASREILCLPPAHPETKPSRFFSLPLYSSHALSIYISLFISVLSLLYPGPRLPYSLRSSLLLSTDPRIPRHPCFPVNID